MYRWATRTAKGSSAIVVMGCVSSETGDKGFTDVGPGPDSLDERR